MARIFGGRSNSVSDQSFNGFVDVGDMRIQWGRNTQNIEGQRAVTLPAAFANGGYTVTATCDNGTAAASQLSRCVYIGGKGTTSFTAFVAAGTDGASSLPFSWQAIGLKP